VSRAELTYHGVMKPKPRTMRINPLLAIAALGIWALIGLGFATDNEHFFGAAAVLFGASLTASFVVQGRRSSAEKAERARVWTLGKPARAVVIDLSSKGGGTNGHPRIDFELEVSAEGEQAYRAYTSVTVDRLAIPRVQPGCTIEVRIDPNNAEHVVIDEKLTYPRPG